MSKKSKHPKYFNAVSCKQIQAIEEEIAKVKRASRKPKKLKVEPVIETVVRCLEEGKSSRLITAIVKGAHQFDISKDTILRFAKTRSPMADASKR